MINNTANFVLHNTRQFKFTSDTRHALSVLLSRISQVTVKSIWNMSIWSGVKALWSRSPRLLLRLTCPSRWILNVYNWFTHVEIIIVLNVFNFNVLILKTIGLLKTKQFSVTLATICSSVFIVFFLHKWIGGLTCLWIYKHACLGLKVLNLKIRCQNIFC